MNPHQEEALARYAMLLLEHPELFEGRENRPIVKDVERVRAFAQASGQVLGVAALTPHAWFLNDLVTSRRPDGETFDHPYLRLIAPPQLQGALGVVILATTDPVSEHDPADVRVVLVEQERHATGTVELELPRGFGLPGSTPPDDALRELFEETGLTGRVERILATTLTDSGLTDTLVTFVHVVVDSEGDGADSRFSVEGSELQEAICGVRWIPLNELWHLIATGRCRDGFTVQALGLWERCSRR